MEVIRDTVFSVMQGLAQKKTGLDGDNPEALLKKALTKKELRHIKFSYFKKGILGISVDSSSWLYNLTLQKESLLAKLNRDSAVVKDIHFRIGEVK